MRKTKSDLVRGWLEKAQRDLTVAERELDATEPFTDIVCFHAQQAAEKYLKACLVWNGISFPKTHALEDLALLAAQQDPDYLMLKGSIVMLTPYAVEARYPEFDEPLLEDAQQAVEIARQVQLLVLQKLPDEVKRERHER